MIRRRIDREPGKPRDNLTKAVLLWIILILLPVLASPPFVFPQWSDEEIEEAKQLANSTGKDRIKLLKDLNLKYNAISPEKSVKFGEEALTLLKQFPNREIQARVLNRISSAYCLLGKYKTALDYAREAQRQAKQAGLGIILGDSLITEGRIYRCMGQYSSASHCFEKALDTFKLTNFKKGTGRVLQALGFLYQEKGDFQNALSSYLKALDIAKETKDTSAVPTSLLNLGTFYDSRGDIEKAKQYYLEAMNLAEKDSNLLSILAGCCNGIGAVHYRQKEYRKAIDYYSKSLAINKKVGNKRSTANGYNNIGLSYLYLGQTGKALFYLNKALTLSTQINNRAGRAEMLRNIGILYGRQEQHDIAISHLKQALDIVLSLASSDFKTEFYKRIGQKPRFASLFVNRLQSSIHERLAHSYYRTNNYKKAYEHFKHFQLIEDEIFNRENTAAINRIETQYRTRLKEKELAILEKDNHIIQLTLDGHRIVRNAFIAVFVLILALQVFIYSRYRLKKKMNKMLEEKNTELDTANEKLRESETNLRDLNHTKDRFFSIIAHDLKNPLHSFISTSDSLQDSFDEMNREQAGGLVRDLHTNSKYLYSLLENLFQWAQSQTGRITFSPENMDIFEAIDMAIYLTGQNAEKKGVKVVSEVAPGTPVHADRSMVATILRNLLDNAVKFTPGGGQVTIKAVNKNQWVEISVTDNGTGMPEDVKNNLFKIDRTVSTPGTEGEKGTGLGLIICKEFIQKHGGQIRVNTELNRGTTFSFTLPVSI